MNSATEKLVNAALDMDGTITLEQRNAVLAVLNGRVPRQWPPLRGILERTPDPFKSPCLAPATPRKYLRRHEAAKHVGCSVRLIDLLKHNGDLPFHRLSRRLIVFKVDDLDSLMERRRIDVSDTPRI